MNPSTLILLFNNNSKKPWPLSMIRSDRGNTVDYNIHLKLFAKKVSMTSAVSLVSLKRHLRLIATWNQWKYFILTAR